MLWDRPRRFEQPPATPCVKVCKFAEGGAHCLGCRRTRAEIKEWGQLSEAERRRLEQDLRRRRR